MKNLKLLGLLAALAVFGACSQDAGELSGKNANGAGVSNTAAKKDGVSVPYNMKNAYRDSDLTKEGAAVVTLPNNTDILYRKDAQKLSVDDLGKKLDEYVAAMDADPKARKTVHIIADQANDYAAVIKILELARRKRIEYARLVVSQNEKGEPTDVFEVKIASDPSHDMLRKPNPNTLVARLLKDGNYLLNVEGGTLETLQSKLKEVFKYRKDQLVLREGTNEVEQTVIIRAPLSAKYGNVVILIDAVKETGANPIVVQIDDLEN